MEKQNQNVAEKNSLWQQPNLEPKSEGLVGINPDAMNDLLQNNQMQTEQLAVETPASTDQHHGIFGGSNDDSQSESYAENNTSEELITKDLESNEVFTSNTPVNEETTTEQSEDMGTDTTDEFVTIAKTKFLLFQKLIKNIERNTEQVNKLLNSDLATANANDVSTINRLDQETTETNVEEDGKVLEGVFNGSCMIGPDGKQYTIPANYASKSKLVEGDILKLTINSSGRFVYKQIGPIERKRIVGRLTQTDSSEFLVHTADGEQWRILTASVTYFKGQPQDEAVILVPKHGKSEWAAVENIVNAV